MKCFIFVFGGTYLLWWLVLDGPAKWDNYFEDKINQDKPMPVFLEDPFGLENFDK